MVNFTDEEAKASWTNASPRQKSWRARHRQRRHRPPRFAQEGDTIEHGDGSPNPKWRRNGETRKLLGADVLSGVRCGPGRGRNWTKKNGACEKAAVRKDAKKGVKIAIGTDAGGGCDGKNQRRAGMFRYAGRRYVEMQAIRTGTAVAAGILAAGKT